MTPKPSPRGWTRRRFLGLGLRLSVLATAGVGFAAKNDLAVERVPLACPGLPPSFAGYTIVQISDLHAGFWTDEEFLGQVVDRVNSLEKDLVVLTGDVVSGSVNGFWKRGPAPREASLALALESLARLAPGDRLAVLGNHDQVDGVRAEGRLVRGLERAGFRVLRNESLEIARGNESIQVAGMDDWWFSGNPDQALEKAEPNGFTILLAHNPDVVAHLPPEKKVDLTLCGHTHGGQVNIPLLTRRIMPIQNPDRYLAGLVPEAHGHTYVNRGIGTLVFPFRFRARPEITVLTLS
ncbi:MAG: metallophosphoesterase [Proteobacteria bacterium]|nr:metallophosphoesterase [Pseudomonadota bacterium]